MITASIKTAVILLFTAVLTGLPIYSCAQVPARGSAQQGLAAKSIQYTYRVYDYEDTTFRVVQAYNLQLSIRNQNPKTDGLRPIPGYAEENTYVDYRTDSVYYQMRFPVAGQETEDSFFASWLLSSPKVQWDTQRIDATTIKYITSVNSNRLELDMATNYKDEVGAPAQVNPITGYGRLDGVLLRFLHNGQVQMELESVQKNKWKKGQSVIPSHLGIRSDRRQLNKLQKERMILTTHVFDNAQLHWGAKAMPIASINDLPSVTDSQAVAHFAGGTVVFKRIHMDSLPSHYQMFAELRQRSNGDAYDRTGSIFVIPHQYARTFFDGMAQHPDSLPCYVGRDGKRYQGIVATADYQPPVELVRFFTPFGVHHFNDRLQIDGLEWEDETYYKQEITDLAPLLRGDVWIGAFIGNYDGGGHLISLDIKAYPGEEAWGDTFPRQQIIPLVNTCNVLEMAGQNYGRLFGTDSLTVSFTIPECCKNGKDSQKITLRYLSTGHGGWGGGDEFNPKENQIFIDGQKRFSHTPWRSDCGTYREWNPVSGNFWNGVSSSDYSRSGWCPGTATQPVYFDLTGLTPGRHTLTIAIPQGEPMEGSFSAWNVSAVLIVD